VNKKRPLDGRPEVHQHGERRSCRKCIIPREVTGNEDERACEGLLWRTQERLCVHEDQRAEGQGVVEEEKRQEVLIMAKYQKGAGLGGYTCTTGPKRGKGGGSGTVFGAYTGAEALNKQSPHRNNGGTGKSKNRAP